MCDCCAELRSESLLQYIQWLCCVVQGRDRLFELLFTQPQHKDQFAHSFLIRSSLFTTFSPRFPDEAQLKDYDQC